MTQGDGAEFWLVFLVVTLATVGFSVLLLLVVYVVMAIALSQLFRKTGVEPWIAWVPVYGYWKWLELGGFNGALAWLSLIPGANYVTWVFLYIGMYRIGASFRKDSSWVVLAVFLPYVWCFLLARDSERYEPAIQSAIGYPPLTGSGSVQSS